MKKVINTEQAEIIKKAFLVAIVDAQQAIDKFEQWGNKEYAQDCRNFQEKLQAYCLAVKADVQIEENSRTYARIEYALYCAISTAINKGRQEEANLFAKVRKWLVSKTS